MKITGSSDWREGLAFGVPVVVAEVVPGEPTRCSVCGIDSPPRERSDLWAVRLPNPKSHAGIVRFYCLEHRPEPPRASAVAAPPSGGAARAGVTRAPHREPTPRRPAVPERVAAVCPNCFVEVPASGLCGMCGERVA